MDRQSLESEIVAKDDKVGHLDVTLSLLVIIIIIFHHQNRICRDSVREQTRLNGHIPARNPFFFRIEYNKLYWILLSKGIKRHRDLSKNKRKSAVKGERNTRIKNNIKPWGGSIFRRVKRDGPCFDYVFIPPHKKKSTNLGCLKNYFY